MNEAFFNCLCVWRTLVLRLDKVVVGVASATKLWTLQAYSVIECMIKQLGEFRFAYVCISTCTNVSTDRVPSVDNNEGEEENKKKLWSDHPTHARSSLLSMPSGVYHGPRFLCRADTIRILKPKSNPQGLGRSKTHVMHWRQITDCSACASLRWS